MKILFEYGTPVPLRHALIGHSVSTAFEMGWSKLANGDLLEAAEGQFDLLITTDQNLRYQQNLSGRRIAILILPTTSWRKIQAQVDHVLNAVNETRPGQYSSINWDSK